MSVFVKIDKYLYCILIFSFCNYWSLTMLLKDLSNSSDSHPICVCYWERYLILNVFVLLRLAGRKFFVPNFSHCSLSFAGWFPCIYSCHQISYVDVALIPSWWKEYYMENYHGGSFFPVSLILHSPFYLLWLLSAMM